MTLKVKKDEKLNKYLDRARERKKPCNMKMTLIPIIFGALGTVHKNLERRR